MVCQKTKGSANVLISPVCEVANNEHNASNCLENNNSKESCLDADSDSAEKKTQLQFQGEWKGNCYPFTFAFQLAASKLPLQIKLKSTCSIVRAYIPNALL